MGDRTWLGAHTGCVLQDSNTLEQVSLTFLSESHLVHEASTQMCVTIFLLPVLYIWEIRHCTVGTSQDGERRFIYWGHRSQEDTVERLIKGKEKERCSDPKACLSEQITNLRQYLQDYLKTTYSVFLNNHTMTHLGETRARIPMNPCRL